MTEAEIMKALEKQRDKVVANEVFVFEVIALINRKNAEIERLKKHNTEMARKHYQDGRVKASQEFFEGLNAVAVRSIEVGHFDSKTHEYITLRTDLLDQIAKEMGVELCEKKY